LGTFKRFLFRRPRILYSGIRGGLVKSKKKSKVKKEEKVEKIPLNRINKSNEEQLKPKLIFDL
jgi:hypothetical protein